MWTDLLRTMHVRAIEDTDNEGQIWPQETRRAATQQASHDAPNASTRAFLHKRSAILMEKAATSLMPGLPVLPDAPAWLCWAGWAAAFAVGWVLAAIGQESEINLLALPLIGILVWNAAVMLLSVLSIGHGASSSGLGGKLFNRLGVHGSASSTRFLQLVQGVWLRRFNRRLRVWLHLAAALLALGSISGMYARGWAREYRAVWESTLLDEPHARQFFGALFLPASKVLGVSIPLERMPAMHRSIDHRAAAPAPALPWIHLYAGTLALFIILPRLLLALVEWQRSRNLVRQALSDDDWQHYAARLLALTDGAGATVQILAHGFSLNNDARDRWRLLAHEEWSDMGSCRFGSIPVGSEAAFVEDWSPPEDQRLMLVFNMAAIPETEVHRWLVEALLEKWRAVKSHPPFAVALDESALRQRWSGFGDHEKRLEQRRQVWLQALENLPVILIQGKSFT